MFRFVFLVASALVLVAAVGADTDQIGVLPALDGRIVGGQNADIRQYPYQISMHYNGRHNCGGSIYSSNIIMSAAHCVTGRKASLMSIVAGSTLLSEKNIEMGVLKYIMHSNYKSSSNDYDVAIIVISGHLQFNDYLQPIALATEHPVTGTEVTVTGWGTLVEGGNSPDRLQQVHVNVVDNNACKKIYGVTVTSRMLCAGTEGGGKDACQFDSGGPLMAGNKLLGIVSWGSGCGRKNYPGVYVSVPALHDWIVNTAKANTIGLA